MLIYRPLSSDTVWVWVWKLENLVLLLYFRNITIFSSYIECFTTYNLIILSYFSYICIYCLLYLYERYVPERYVPEYGNNCDYTFKKGFYLPWISSFKGFYRCHKSRNTCIYISNFASLCFTKPVLPPAYLPLQVSVISHTELHIHA